MQQLQADYSWFEFKKHPSMNPKIVNQELQEKIKHEDFQIGQ